MSYPEKLFKFALHQGAITCTLFIRMLLFKEHIGPFKADIYVKVLLVYVCDSLYNNKSIVTSIRTPGNDSFAEINLYITHRHLQGTRVCSPL